MCGTITQIIRRISCTASPALNLPILKWFAMDWRLFAVVHSHIVMAVCFAMDRIAFIAILMLYAWGKLSACLQEAAPGHGEVHPQLFVVPNGHNDSLPPIAAHLPSSEILIYSLELLPCLPSYNVLT